MDPSGPEPLEVLNSPYQGVLLPVVVGSILNVLSVLLQQGISVLFTGTVRRGDIVLLGFQPVDDLFDGLIIRGSAFSVKVGQYLVQTFNADLCVIKEAQ